MASALFRRLIALSTAALLLAGTVGVALASPPMPAEGTLVQTAPTGFAFRFAGPNLIIEQSTVGSVSGTLTGDFADSLRVVIHPNGKFTAKGTITCQCTVDGKEGVLELVVTDTGQELDGIPTFAGRAVITSASGAIAGLRGVLQLEGTVDPVAGLSQIAYTGQIHFHP